MNLVCAKCSALLRGRPRILVNEVLYCYRCAKFTVTQLQRPLTEKYESLLNCHRQKETARQKWESLLRKHEMADWLSLGIIACCLILGITVGMKLNNARYVIGGVCGYFLGQLVVTLINYILTARFRKDNPCPDLPGEPPSQHEFVFWNFEQHGVHTSRIIEGTYRMEILDRDNYICQSCGLRFPAETLEVHHVRPRANGGQTRRSNLVTLCIDCHKDEDWFGHIHKYSSKKVQHAAIHDARSTARVLARH